MGIPESQLETWTHPAPTKMAKDTRESILKALEGYEWPENVSYDVYLQGSYKNDTRIVDGKSDVDVVVELANTWLANKDALSTSQRELYDSKTITATYVLSDFKADVLSALYNHYDSKNVAEDNKCIKLTGSARLPADIIPCIGYRLYGKVEPKGQPDRFYKGMTFDTLDGTRIINYPKLHYDNGVSKMKLTDKRYKSAVRIYKNIKKKLIADAVIDPDLTTSYFLECLLYNVPSSKFGSTWRDTFCDTINWLSDEASLEDLICQNGIVKLCGATEQHWNSASIRTLLDGYKTLWHEW